MSGYNSASTPAFMVTAVSDSNGNCQRQTGFDNGGINADQALAAQIAADTLLRRRREAATLIAAIWRGRKTRAWFAREFATSNSRPRMVLRDGKWIPGPPPTPTLIPKHLLPVKAQRNASRVRRCRTL